MKTKIIDGSRIAGNISGGLTAGIVALPLALAFGVASGAGAAAGLYGAIALGLVAALFGGTPTQISGPTGPMTVVTAAAIAAFPGQFPVVMAVVLLAGAFQVAMGMLRLGRFVRFIPYPVISGFMSGIGVIIILLQIHPLLGAASVQSPLQAVMHFGDAVRAFNPASLALGVLTLLIVFATPARVTRVFPSPLIALLAGTLLACGMHLHVPTIGEIPAGLPAVALPSFPPAVISKLVGMGLMLALLGAIDTLLTSLVADSLTKQHHDSNRELVGQGIGNMAAALVGGIPGAGATMRTVVNIKAGGRSRLSGVVHAGLLLAVLVWIGPQAAHIPLAVLAGILFKVGLDIIDYRLLRLVRRAPRPDLTVMAVVFAITVFVDLIVAVGVGVTLASVLLTYRIAHQTRIRIFEAPSQDEGMDRARQLQHESDFGVHVIAIRGPFFFGTSATMQDKINALLGARTVVIDCTDVSFLDVSAVFALGEMVEKLKDRGILTLLAAGEAIRHSITDLDLEKVVGPECIFDGLDAALAAARHLVKTRPQGKARHVPAEISA